MINYMPLHAALSYYMLHYMPITWSITCLITCSTIPLHVPLHDNYIINYMIYYILNYLPLHALNGMKFPEPMITCVSCAAFHTQEAPLLKRQRCSRSSSSAATIDEGLAREDPPQLPQTWKHRAGVSKNNETWAEQFKMGWRIQSTAKLKMGWRIQSPDKWVGESNPPR